jgi:hypothetical protein
MPMPATTAICGAAALSLTSFGAAAFAIFVNIDI